ncbi:MAG: hypothetical protein HYR88_12420 [Verrucomicrobia bacterium]|nr:hypothetical protein [Verrucomicrobiota bacterium]MBI3869246.1 hypothetical protein [Verrucomicrobiota bacterium]
MNAQRQDEMMKPESGLGYGMAPRLAATFGDTPPSQPGRSLIRLGDTQAFAQTLRTNSCQNFSSAY